jgi:hypothetical protein
MDDQPHRSGLNKRKTQSGETAGAAPPAARHAHVRIVDQQPGSPLRRHMSGRIGAVALKGHDWAPRQVRGRLADVGFQTEGVRATRRSRRSRFLRANRSDEPIAGKLKTVT